METAGQRLSADLTLPSDSYAVTVLIVEASRIADRLEKLDAIVSGEEEIWARLANGRDGDLEVKIDGALSEARQQATVMRHLIAEVKRLQALTPAVVANDDLAD